MSYFFNSPKSEFTFLQAPWTLFQPFDLVEKLQKMGKNCRRLFLQVLYGILHRKVSHSRCGREVTAKKCTKTFDAPRAE